MKVFYFLCFIFTLFGCQPLSQIRSEDLLTAVGTASISAQMGSTQEEKQFKAMRASKLEAYKELSEQIYGLRVSGSIDIDDQRLSNDRTNGAVDGIIRGAELVSSYVVGDSYITELKLNLRKMDRMKQYGEAFHVPQDNTVLF